MKVMLAANYSGTENLKEFVVSYKLDGIRCLVNENEALTRSGKVIRNRKLKLALIEAGRYVKRHIPEIDWLDGELVYQDQDSGTWGKTSSIVMSFDKEYTGIEYHIFDYIPAHGHRHKLFLDRLEVLKKISIDFYFLGMVVKVVDRFNITDHQDLHNAMDIAVATGYEGLMLNRLYAYYKHGRATPLSQELVKLKKWDHAESKVIAVDELMHNIGEPERGRDGIVRRSKVAENLVGTDVLGALVLDNGLKVGTGFTDKQRRYYWTEECPIGKVCRYKYLPSVGDAPRHPVFISLGDK